MKIGSDCSGECFACACVSLCLAGHGDDDFSQASKEQILERYYDTQHWKRCKQDMKKYIKDHFNIDVEDVFSESNETDAEKLIDIERNYIVTSINSIKHTAYIDIGTIIETFRRSDIDSSKMNAVLEYLVKFQCSFKSITEEAVKNIERVLEEP